MAGLKTRRDFNDRQREIERIEREKEDLQKAMDEMAAAKVEMENRIKALKAEAAEEERRRHLTVEVDLPNLSDGDDHEGIVDILFDHIDHEEVVDNVTLSQIDLTAFDLA